MNQILRTIDKVDKIGRAGVVELLQKPAAEFGADLDPVRAGMIGLFLDAKGETDDATISNLSAFFTHAHRVRSRLDLVIIMEQTDAFDRLISLPTNDDQTWKNGGRPANIGWALDDIVEMFR